MHPDARALLWDAQQAGRLILVFLNEVDLDRYLADVLIASAVERQLTIIGESLNRLARVDPATAVARLREAGATRILLKMDI